MQPSSLLELKINIFENGEGTPVEWEFNEPLT